MSGWAYMVPVTEAQAVVVDAGRVVIDSPDLRFGPDVEVYGEPADLIRLSDALRQAALRAIDAKVAAAREAAS